MPISRPVTDKLQLEIYRESQKNLLDLVHHLPRRQLANLAREVLVNVAQQDAKIGYSLVNPSSDQIEALCDALVSTDESAGADFILGLQAEGVSPDVVYLKYLARAARMLGDWWEEDKVTFVTVTLGTSRILSIMRAMHRFFAPKKLPSRKSAVFASVPGEDHTVGIRMTTDFFRREGWDIDLKIGLSQDEFMNQVDWSRTCMVGLSYGGSHSFEALSSLMIAINVRSPAVEVFVGGQDVEEIEPITSKLGFTVISSDADQALKTVDGMWSRLLKTEVS